MRSTRRPRDYQKSKLYAAERACDTWHGQETMSLEYARAYVERVVTSRWWKARSDIRGVTVKDGRGNTSAHWDGVSGKLVWPRRQPGDTYRGVPDCIAWGEMTLPRWARTPIVILHELAHGLTPPQSCASHGPEFAANFLALVRRWLGDGAWRQLRDSFLLDGVHFGSRRPRAVKTRQTGSWSLPIFNGGPRPNLVTDATPKSNGWVAHFDKRHSGYRANVERLQRIREMEFRFLEDDDPDTLRIEFHRKPVEVIIE